MFKHHEINVIGKGHGLDLSDKVKGQVRIDVEDADKADRILACYVEADQRALAILQEPPADSGAQQQ